jgi:hypothetical protein
VVLEAEEVLELEPLVVVEVEFPAVVLVIVAREEVPVEEEPVEEEPELVEDAAELLEAPPINWNCGLKLGVPVESSIWIA